ncbi:MAG: RdgB/HAM1 family non-canonical purine NTP pyrophosphatase [Bacteroidales bacterium]|nr:MAG: RdgB/HAM1 family non-canonical purine NTP pyrophosphatase [Bacteroidales bacterium]
MKRKLIFATNNQHKVNEIRNILGDRFDLASLKDLKFNENIPEEHHSLEENAAGKALFIYNRYKTDCFADDTGLEVEALDGEPGVYSARYAGDQCNFDDNINKILNKLKGINNRKARFRTVISLVENGRVINFEGSVYGRILDEKRGIHGFGYDPVFLPDGHEITFAEMTMREKNRISHRAKAIEKLVKHFFNKHKI